MQEQYLGKESNIKKEHDLLEKQRLEKLGIDSYKIKIEKDYLKMYGK